MTSHTSTERSDADTSSGGDPRLGWRAPGTPPRSGTTREAGHGSTSDTPYASGPAVAEAGQPAQPPVASGGPASDEPAVPSLRRRRDGILPAVAAALSVRGETYTCTGSKTERGTELHPLVSDFLNKLGPGQRARQAGRCPEAVLLSRVLSSTEAARSRKRNRKPLSHNEAKRALKHAKLTTRHIREHGDPLHGSFAPPCRSCAPMLQHFGVRTVAEAPEEAS